MPSQRRRSSWSEPLTIAGVGEGHTHQPTRLWKVVGVVALLVLFAMAGAMGVMWWQQNLSDAYAEQQRQQQYEAAVDVVCDVLESLPVTPLLDEVRKRHGCGPGRPVEDFPPDVQRDITSRGADAGPAPAERSPSSEPPPVGMGGAVPDPPRPPPYYPPGSSPLPSPGRPVEPSPEPGPVVDLGPLTEVVDDVLCPLVCLEPS